MLDFLFYEKFEMILIFLRSANSILIYDNQNDSVLRFWYTFYSSNLMNDVWHFIILTSWFVSFDCIRDIESNLFFFSKKFIFCENKSWFLRMIRNNEFFDLTSYRISNDEISIERFSKQFIEYSICDKISFQFFSYLSIKKHFRIVSTVWLNRFVWSFAEKWYAMIIFNLISHWLNIAFQKSELNFELRSLINRAEVFQFLKTCFQ